MSETEPASQRRRMPDIVRACVILAVLIFVAFPTIVLGVHTFEPNGLFDPQVGAPEHMYPYERIRKPVYGDSLSFTVLFEPWGRVVHEAYSSGQLPLWNPYAGLGQPLAGNFMSAPFNVLQIPAMMHPTQHVWDLVFLFRMWFGAVGFYLLLCAIGATRNAAISGASIFMLSPYLVIWMGALDGFVIAFFPWTMLAVLRMVERSTPGRFAGVALGSAGMLLGGQPEEAWSLGVLGLGWLATTWFQSDRNLRRLGEIALAGLCGVLLALPQLLPAAELVSRAANFQGGFAADRPIGQTMALIQVHVVGDFSLWQLNGVGIAVFALMIAGIASHRHSGMRSIRFMAAALVIWGVGVFNLPGVSLLRMLPFGGHVNFPVHSSGVPLVATSVCAAAGLQALAGRSRRALVATVVAALAAMAFMFLNLAFGSVHPEPASSLRVLCAVVLVSIFGTVVAIMAIASRTRPGLTWLLAGVLVVQQMALVPRTYAKPFNVARQADFTRYVVDNQRPGDRVMSLGRTMRPNYAGAFGLADIRYRDALVPKRYVRMVNAVVGAPELDDVWPGSRSLERTNILGSQLYQSLGVRYIMRPVDGIEMPDSYELRYTDRTYRRQVWENTSAFPRAWVVGSVVAVDNVRDADRSLRSGIDLRQAAIVERPTAAMRDSGSSGSATTRRIGFNRQRYEVRTKSGGVLVTSDMNYPGWRAYVDGVPSPIRPANVGMRAVAVPKGRHDVDFRYEPRSFRLGCLLAGLAGFVIALRFVFGFVRRRAANATPTQSRGRVSS